MVDVVVVAVPGCGFLGENLLKGERGVRGDDRESTLGGETTGRVSAGGGSDKVSGCGTALRPILGDTFSLGRGGNLD